MQKNLGTILMIILIGFFIYTRPINVDSLILQNADSIKVDLVDYEEAERKIFNVDVDLVLYKDIVNLLEGKRFSKSFNNTYAENNSGKSYYMRFFVSSDEVKKTQIIHIFSDGSLMLEDDFYNYFDQEEEYLNKIEKVFNQLKSIE